MTHDELLAKIGNPVDEGYQYGDIVFNKALHAVVELHKPDSSNECIACCHDFTYEIYPCPTIKAIESVLNG